ncbi:MAG: nucleotidyltransferase domain-containing protein [Clostridiales bacterium]|nr:nucleotidyltransferase domain-containing protein [Clostridiales bacterium]
MCKLMPFVLENGNTIQVSEYKIDRLKQYVKMFSTLNGVDRVILFGSALEERCRKDSDMDFCMLYPDEQKSLYRENLKKMWRLYPESSYDDFLSFDTKRFDENDHLYTVIQDIKNKGVVIYDRKW